MALLTGLVTALSSIGQEYRFHGSAMYALDETAYVSTNPSESGAVSTVKGGLGFGLGVERRKSQSFGFELIYMRQDTRVKDWYYPSGTGVSKTDVKAAFNHLMVGPNLYFDGKGRNRPFVGGMAGAALSTFRNPDNGVKDSRASLAWGVRGGLDLAGAGAARGRVFANLLWTMKGLGGDISNSVAGSQAQQGRNATMIQLRFGASLTLEKKSKPTVANVAVPVSFPGSAKKMQTPDEVFQSRVNRLFGTFQLAGDTLHISIYDNAMVDRDSVSLYVNGDLRIRNLEVRSESKRISFPITEMNDTTDFVMLAENLGSIPPNTAIVKAVFDGREHEVLMESTDSSSAMIRFLNPGGRPRRTVQASADQSTVTDPEGRKTRMVAELKRQSDDIRERIPEAEVFTGERDIRVLFSTLMMFRKNSYELSESHRRQLSDFQSIFLKYPDTRLVIEGHTDDSGEGTINMNLSQKRADAVLAELLRMGTPTDRMTVRGFGETQSRYPNDSETNRQRNRRVELVIIRD